MLRFTFLMLCGCFVQTTFYHQPEAQHLLPFRSAKMGHEADYPIWFAHGCTGSCRLFLTASETRQEGSLRARKRVFRVAVLWRRAGGKSYGSNSDVSSPSKVDTVGEGEFETEPAA